MKAVVTGAAGFIGSHLADRLLSAMRYQFGGHIEKSASKETS